MYWWQAFNIVSPDCIGGMWESACKKYSCSIFSDLTWQWYIIFLKRPNHLKSTHKGCKRIYSADRILTVQIRRKEKKVTQSNNVVQMNLSTSRTSSQHHLQAIFTILFYILLHQESPDLYSPDLYPVANLHLVFTSCWLTTSTRSWQVIHFFHLQVNLM